MRHFLDYGFITALSAFVTVSSVGQSIEGEPVRRMERRAMGVVGSITLSNAVDRGLSVRGLHRRDLVTLLMVQCAHQGLALEVIL